MIVLPLLDTSTAAQARFDELRRAETPAQRAAILGGLMATVRRLAEVSEQATHPDASPREIQARVAARLYGPATASRFFPDVLIE